MVEPQSMTAHTFAFPNSGRPMATLAAALDVRLEKHGAYVPNPDTDLPSVETGVHQLVRRDTAWLSMGWDGGFERTDPAYNVSVPEGRDRTDFGACVAERRDRARFEIMGSVLLAGVGIPHARGARLESVAAYATVAVEHPPGEGSAVAERVLGTYPRIVRERDRSWCVYF